MYGFEVGFVDRKRRACMILYPGRFKGVLHETKEPSYRRVREETEAD
jgi:hypothetical protein